MKLTKFAKTLPRSFWALLTAFLLAACSTGTVAPKAVVAHSVALNGNYDNAGLIGIVSEKVGKNSSLFKGYVVDSYFIANYRLHVSQYGLQIQPNVRSSPDSDFPPLRLAFGESFISVGDFDRSEPLFRTTGQVVAQEGQFVQLIRDKVPPTGVIEKLLNKAVP